MTLSTSVKDNESSKFRSGKDGAVVAVTLSDDFYTNDLDEDGSVTFIGKSNGSVWQIQKITELSSGLSLRYATIKENTTILNYSDAWASRLTLTYAAR